MIEYKSVKGEAIGEITEKNSRFIATIRPVSSQEEALAFIEEMKKKYWDARHNCSAYIIGADKPLERCSDDGEPSRTAGMPMLDILHGDGLSDIAVVVTRYFGGVLLGTGGLVRAYQGAVRAALNNAHIITRRTMHRQSLTTDYTSYGKFQYYAASDGIIIENTDFADAVTITFLASDEVLGTISAKMTEITSGKCIFTDLGYVQTDV